MISIVMEEISGKSPALEELEAYYSSLPDAFKQKLYFGRTGIPGDFVNNYCGIYVHIQFILEEMDTEDGVPVADIDELNGYVGIMTTYRSYLEKRIGEVLGNNPDIRMDVGELMVRLLDLPLVAELEANIAEIKGMRFEPGPEFLPKFERLRKLVDLGVGIIKDTIAIEQVRALFPH